MLVMQLKQLQLDSAMEPTKLRKRCPLKTMRKSAKPSRKFTKIRRKVN